MTLKKFYSIAFTLLIVLVALVLARALWLHYMHDPWTRDARVRANVITMAPDVSGFVVDLKVHDNQEVKQGDLLFQVDPSRYRIALDHAKAQVKASKTTLELRKSEAKRRADASNLVVSQENRNQADSAVGIAEANYEQAQAALASAKLDLKRTEVRAPVDGYITNLDLQKGDYVHSGQPALALIDKHSYWIYGYFEETKLPLVQVGDKANITLMSGTRMTGHVSSIARGIYDSDNPDSEELTANVSPTFDWVRLARRIPVHITIDEMPDNQVLAAGATCTVTLENDHHRAWWNIF